MDKTVEESKVKGSPEATQFAFCAKELKEMTGRIDKGVKKAKAALEDSKTAAGRFVKRSQYAVEDGVTELVHQVKRNPLSSLAIAFAAGAVFAFLAPRLGKRRAA